MAKQVSSFLKRDKNKVAVGQFTCPPQLNPVPGQVSPRCSPTS